MGGFCISMAHLKEENDMKKKVNPKWLDIKKIIQLYMDWNVFIGARRIGKTYGIIEHFIDDKPKFLYIRRTKEELNRAVEEGIFDEHNRIKGCEYHVKYNKDKGVGECFNADDPEPVGKIFALSVIRSLRGVNYSKYDELFFDEVIPEEGARASDSDGITTIQAFETIFGNRELPPLNLPPMKVWLAMNPINAFDPILSALGLVDIICGMAATGQKNYRDPERSLYIYCGGEAQIADLKRATSLYKLIGAHSDTANHILNGTFRGDLVKTLKRKVDFKHYKCVFEIDNIIYIYVNKSEGDWHCSNVRQGCELHFQTKAPFELRNRFSMRYRLLKSQCMVSYETGTIAEVMDALLA